MNIKDIIDVMCNCPREYHQNIKKLKQFKIMPEDICYKSGLEPFRAFFSCKLYGTKEKCWKELFQAEARK